MEFIECGLSDADTIAELEANYIECSWSKAVIEESIKNPDYIFIKAVDGDELLGYGAVQVVLDEGNICNVAVFEKHRNKGVASGIINTMLKKAKDRGAEVAFLEVSSANAGALALYRKLGFKEIGERKNYYKSGNAIIMSLNI